MGKTRSIKCVKTRGVKITKGKGTGERDTVEAAIRILCAPIAGVTVRHMRRVQNGDSNNDKVITTLCLFREGLKELTDNVKNEIAAINQ